MTDFDTRNKPVLPFLTCGLLSGLALAAPGCEDVAGGLLEQCGLVCPAEGIAEGNASISGFANVDAFFSAVITVRDAAFQVSGTVRGELESMAASLEIEGYADMSIGELSAAVTAGLEAKFAVALDGGLQIKFEPAKCEASLDVAVSAAAECDVTADPGSIEAKCEGSCEVSAEVAADCQAMGTLECTGPQLDCQGSCSGDCQLMAAASCEGTCRGTCSGTCTVTNAQGECDGACDGMCQGTCELEAGGSCSGSCEGSCTYDGSDAGCSGGATASCDVSAMADASCEGSCEGKVTPPEVSAECEASVEAKASASVECTPPSLSVSFQWSAELQGDVQAQAEFKAWLEGFKANFAGMLAASAKLEFVLDAAGGLVAAAGGAVEGSLSAIASGDLDLKGGVGIACALTELESVGTALASATSEIEGSISASASIAGAVGG